MCKSIQIEDGKALKIIHQANLNKYYSHNRVTSQKHHYERAPSQTHMCTILQIDEIN